jgi:transposase
MASPIRLRHDFDARGLRGLAKASRDPDRLRRLLSLAGIYDGGSRGAAARIWGAGLQTVRDWVLRFNERGPQGLIDPKG